MKIYIHLPAIWGFTRAPGLGPIATWHQVLILGYLQDLQVLTGDSLGRKADGARPVEALDHVNQAWRSCWCFLLSSFRGFTLVAVVVLQELARFRELGSRIGEAWRLGHCRWK